jgi:hypothetical protein
MTTEQWRALTVLTAAVYVALLTASWLLTTRLEERHATTSIRGQPRSAASGHRPKPSEPASGIDPSRAAGARSTKLHSAADAQHAPDRARRAFE